MGATEEQMALVETSSMDHVSYILILYSLAFLVFLFANICIYIWDRVTSTNALAKPLYANGHAVGGESRVNGRTPEDQRIRDAEEFELDGLVSDEEDDSAQLLKRGETRERASGEPGVSI